MNAQLNLPLIQNHCWNQVLSEFCMGFELERYQGATYWRRMETEALCLVGKIYPIPCRASCFASVNLEETVEFILFLQIDRGKTVSAARNWTNFAPQADATTLAFASVSILLLWSHPISHTTFLISRRNWCLKNIWNWGLFSDRMTRVLKRPRVSYSSHLSNGQIMVLAEDGCYGCQQPSLPPHPSSVRKSGLAPSIEQPSPLPPP